jgi:hypothetical protein
MLWEAKTLTLQQRFRKAQIWAIAKTIIHCLNLVVTTCTMNQSKGHWLLSYALIIVINLLMAMDFETDPLDGNEIFNLFDVELNMLSKNMQQEVVKVIKPFSKKLKTFDSHQVHNMW